MRALLFALASLSAAIVPTASHAQEGEAPWTMSLVVKVAGNRDAYPSASASWYPLPMDKAACVQAMRPQIQSLLDAVDSNRKATAHLRRSQDSSRIVVDREFYDNSPLSISATMQINSVTDGILGGSHSLAEVVVTATCMQAAR